MELLISGRKRYEMSIHQETELGIIKLPTKFFASAIENIFKLPYFDGKVWPATKKGKVLEEPSMSNMFMQGDLASNIQVSYGDEDEIIIEISVIMRFGVSISRVSEQLCNAIYNEFRDTVEPEHMKIILNVIGMKSKHIAKRDLVIEKEYSKA